MSRKFYRWKNKVSIMQSFTPVAVWFVSRFTSSGDADLGWTDGRSIGP